MPEMTPGVSDMVRIGKALVGSAVMAWAVLDLTGSGLAASLSALLPLGLGLPNLAPFAALGLPLIVGGAALAGRLLPDALFQQAAVRLLENAGQFHEVILASLQRGGVE